MAEFDGIVNQVVHDLLDFSHVRVDHLDCIGKSQVKANVFGRAGSLKGGGRILDYPVDVKIGPGEIALGIQGV